MERWATLTLVAQTGCRIGSFAACNANDEARSGIKCSDFKFTRTGPGEWLLKCRITHLKGFNNEETRREVEPWLRAMSSAHNLPLEAAIPCLLLLIRRGLLKEQGKDGKVITSVAALWASPAHQFVGISEEPFLRSWDSRTSKWVARTTTSAANGLRSHTSHVGLPWASFHLLRRDVAARARVLHGPEVARLILNHDQATNTLGAHYTGGVTGVDLVAITTAEMGKHVQYQQRRLESAAVLAIANARAASDKAGDDNGRPLSKPQAKNRSPKEVWEFMLTVNADPEGMKGERASLEKAIEELRGMGLRIFDIDNSKLKNSFTSARKTASPAALRLIDQATASLEKIRKATKQANVRLIQLSKKTAAEEARNDEHAPTRTHEDVHRAQKQLKDDAAKAAEDWAERSAAFHIKACAGVSAGAVTSSSVVDSGTGGDNDDDDEEGEADEATQAFARTIQTNVEAINEASLGDDDEGGFEQTFRQSRVVDDSVVGSNNEPTETFSEKMTAVQAARVARLFFLESLALGDDRLHALTEQMVAFCPFCESHAEQVPTGLPLVLPPIHTDREKRPQFGKRFEIASDDAYLRSRRQAALLHLRLMHPEVLTALQAGKRLNKGLIVSKLWPAPVPQHPSIGGDALLALYRPMQLSNDPLTSALVATYFGPPASMSRRAPKKEKTLYTKYLSLQSKGQPLRTSSKQTTRNLRHAAMYDTLRGCDTHSNFKVVNYVRFDPPQAWQSGLSLRTKPSQKVATEWNAADVITSRHTSTQCLGKRIRDL